ncbi:restriction endonuclease subunit S [Providencia manganoxydans]|uniref:restriction endonuclease subunit S n=1 Tax=Providencia manganoxydans TaxID=2923283 RepID=UPI003B9CA460
MSEWIKTTLNEIADVIGGGTPSTKNEAFWGGEIPWITPKDLTGYTKMYISHGERFITKNGLDNSSARLLPEGTVLMSSRAPIGYVAIAANPITTNQGFKSLVPNTELANNKFLYFWIKNNKQYIDSLGSGTTFAEVSGSVVKSLEIELPSLPEQKAIASVLSALDNKIDLLHRQNKTLESMTETLFRQWFVEEAQDDWEEVTLSDVCHRITDGAHASPKSIDNGWAMASVKDMETWGINYDTCRRISKEDYDELVRADCKALKGDILIAKDGSYLKHVFLLEKDIDVVLLSSIAMLRPNGKYDPMLLTIFLKMNSTREEMENIVTGAVIPRIVLKDFRKFPIRLPPREYQTKALIQISPIFRKCWLNNSQIKKLENLRDTLLPKLMSGEVRVNYTPEEIKQ